MTLQAFLLETRIEQVVRMGYLLHLPKGYQATDDDAIDWPLVVFLHGAGERGEDLALVKKHGIPKLLEECKELPFIILAPQCPLEGWWSSELQALDALLADIVERYRVDKRRIYLTGLSMGGYGTWHWAIAHKGTFAAIAPVCGGVHGPSRIVEQLKNLPVWAFHGAKDPVVPIGEQQKLVEALRAVGGNVRFTVYPEAEHDSWTETYANPELYSWLLSQSL